MNLSAGLFALIIGLAALAPAAWAEDEERMQTSWYLQCYDIKSPDRRLKCYDDIRDGYLRPRTQESHREPGKAYQFRPLSRVVETQLRILDVYLSTSGDIYFQEGEDAGMLHENSSALRLDFTLMSHKTVNALRQQCHAGCHRTVYGYIEISTEGPAFHVQEVSKE
jgi:hypothetical protein